MFSSDWKDLDNKKQEEKQSLGLQTGFLWGNCEEKFSETLFLKKMFDCNHRQQLPKITSAPPEVEFATRKERFHKYCQLGTFGTKKRSLTSIRTGKTVTHTSHRNTRKVNKKPCQNTAVIHESKSTT